MGVVTGLKEKYGALWRAAIDHRFITELGDGTLSREQFSRYFVQDYIFINDLVKTAGIAVAKAPDNRSARPIEEFLGAILGAEDSLFVDVFRTLGVAESEYRGAEALPTTTAFGNFLVRIACEGSFREICTVLFATEGVYLAWGDRLRSEGADPAAGGSDTGKFYQGWIDLHTDETLGPIVRYLSSVIDEAEPNELARLEQLFEQALHYEVAFWEMAYGGEEWP
ncbi:MAG: TenA family protein [Chloroflexi bacterium]|nr:TenA family protein [Chloroflexota bacterium]